MYATSSSTRIPMRTYARLLHFAACPAIALCGAVTATNFPFLPNDHTDHEIRMLQYCAMATAGVTSLVTAIVFQWNRSLRTAPLLHFLCLFAVLLFNHFLWVEPIWGFHHDYSLGIFAWLFIGGEDGFKFLPNPLGLPLTVFTGWLVHAAVRYWQSDS